MIIRRQVRAAVEQARTSGSTHVASAVNVGGEGHGASVYSDEDLTVLTTDGRTQVIRHREDDGRGDAPRIRIRGAKNG